MSKVFKEELTSVVGAIYHSLMELKTFTRVATTSTLRRHVNEDEVDKKKGPE